MDLAWLLQQEQFEEAALVLVKKFLGVVQEKWGEQFEDLQL